MPTTTDIRLAVAFPLLLAGLLAAAGPAGANPGGSVTDSKPAIESAVGAMEAGRYKTAVRHLKRHLRRNSDDADALNLLGYSLRKLEKFDDAEQYYLEALEIEPRHAGANEYLGELYLQTGRPELARERLAVLEDACPGQCEERDELTRAIAEYARQNGP